MDVISLALKPGGEISERGGERSPRLTKGMGIRTAVPCLCCRPGRCAKFGLFSTRVPVRRFAPRRGKERGLQGKVAEMNVPSSSIAAGNRIKLQTG